VSFTRYQSAKEQTKISSAHEQSLFLELVANTTIPPLTPEKLKMLNALIHDPTMLPLPSYDMFLPLPQAVPVLPSGVAYIDSFFAWLSQIPEFQPLPKLPYPEVQSEFADFGFGDMDWPLSTSTTGSESSQFLDSVIPSKSDNSVFGEEMVQLTTSTTGIPASGGEMEQPMDSPLPTSTRRGQPLRVVIPALGEEMQGILGSPSSPLTPLTSDVEDSSQLSRHRPDKGLWRSE